MLGSKNNKVKQVFPLSKDSFLKSLYDKKAVRADFLTMYLKLSGAQNEDFAQE